MENESGVMLHREVDTKLNAYWLQLCKKKFTLCLWLCKNERTPNGESLGARVILFISLKVSEEGFVYSYSQHNNQCEGTPRVSVSPLVLTGKACGGRLECCFWEDAEIMRSLEGQSCVWWRPKMVAEYQFRGHFCRWACRETADLPTTWDKLALPNSSARTSAWEQRSAPVGQLSQWHSHSTAIYSRNRKLLNKCWSDRLSGCFRYGHFLMWWAQR